MKYRKYEIEHENKKIKTWMRTFFVTDDMEMFLPASLFTGREPTELFFIASFEAWPTIMEQNQIYLSEHAIKKLMKEFNRSHLIKHLEDFISKVALLDNVF